MSGFNPTPKQGALKVIRDFKMHVLRSNPTPKQGGLKGNKDPVTGQKYSNPTPKEGVLKSRAIKSFDETQF